MLYSGTDPETYITDYTLVNEDKVTDFRPKMGRKWLGSPLCGRVRNVKWFRGGLVFKAHSLLYRSTRGLRVIKKKPCEPRPTLKVFFMTLKPRVE